MSQIYFKKVLDREFGFEIQFPYERGKDYYLLIRCEGRQAKIKYNEELIAKRQAARKEKNFALADEIRGQLLERGIVLEDTREGVKWKRA